MSDRRPSAPGSERPATPASSPCLARRGSAPEEPAAPKPGFISALAAALGFGGQEETNDAPRIEFREHWDRFVAQSEAEIPSDDEALSDALAAALALAVHEWPDALDVAIRAVGASAGDQKCSQHHARH